jgi:hypothetical protein
LYQLRRRKSRPTHWPGHANEAAQAVDLLPGIHGGHWLILIEEITMAGSGSGVTNTANASSGSSGLLSQLNQAESQALSDMIAIQKNQIIFNEHMNDAQTAKNVATSFQQHG